MQEIRKSVIFSLYVFAFVVSITFSERKPQTGVITGGFFGTPANAILNYNMTNSSQHHHDITTATIIERGETLENGCFKQIVKEPDRSDMKRFIATEQLICPPGVNITKMAQAYQKPAGTHVIMPFFTTHPNGGSVQTNSTGQRVNFTYAQVYHAPAVLPVPINGTPIALLPAPQRPGLTQQTNQTGIPNHSIAQVIVLSKKEGYYDTRRKTNSANTTLAAINRLVIILWLAIFTYFM